MRRVWRLQNSLRRGRWTNGLGVALFLALLAVLLISVYSGMRQLPIS